MERWVVREGLSEKVTFKVRCEEQEDGVGKGHRKQSLQRLGGWGWLGLFGNLE